ncbi:autophagy-related protein 18h isoform X2 [Cryptomeria japonica]|uniref:autophagy-related protein 18h isoform X2 n=1 Tax=Cryptomeria japonica TaxID=3369 RepID=UPI0025AC860A|nr:autophagy-related protein 18h isoform X2 [Cryptomeria japonica]
MSHLNWIQGNFQLIVVDSCKYKQRFSKLTRISVSTQIFWQRINSWKSQVQWAGFDKLEVRENVVRSVLLLGFMNGFQVWDIEDVDDVRELISKQDGRVVFLQMQPRPIITEQADDKFNAARPLLLVVTGDGTPAGGNVQNGYGSGYGGGIGNPSQPGSNNFVPTVVLFYSLRTHSYAHVLRFRQAVYTVRCSRRFVAIALASQIRCYDAITLEDTFSVLTYPIPQGVQVAGSINIGYGPLAVGPRWLAYAGNQALFSSTGRISPQHLTPSPGASPSTSPANGSLVAHYAKESSKQIAAGIVTLGDMGYKTFTKYCSEFLPDGANSPRPGSPSWRHSTNGLPGHAHEPDYAGMVIVRDYVSKSVVAQFRAHTSPLSALCFDPSGTLLVTASVHGHNLNVFRIMPFLGGNGSSSSSFDVNTSYAHLYKLSRGVTNAVIQDISFSDDSHWIAISSSRGTSHLFAISPFGGAVSLHTHEGNLVDESRASLLVPSRTIHWWLSPGPLRANQQPLPQPAPAITLSVVNRIKNGNGGWRGTGAIAAFFRSGGGGRSMQSESANFSSKDELWIFSPSGHVIQYSLRLSNGVETEKLRKWDVCQIPIRVEREEDIENLSKHATSSELPGRNGLGHYKNGTIPSNSQGLGKGGIDLEEKHHWYLSNAEVQMLQTRTPIWAKSEVYFQVMRPECMDAAIFNEDAYSGEIEIEKVPTRVLEVGTKDLIPVFDNFQDFKEVHKERASFHGSLAGAKTMNIHQHKDEITQYGMDGTNFSCGPIQRSSSGSSCGSAGGFLAGHTIVANGYHHAHQDSQDHMDRGFYSDSPTTFFHHLPCPTSSGKEELLEPSNNFKVTNMNLNGKSNPAAIWQQPMDIPRGNRVADCNIQAHVNSVQMNNCSRSLPANGCGLGKKYVVNGDVSDTVGVIFEGHITDNLASAKTDMDYNLSSKVSRANVCQVDEENENHSTTSEVLVKGISSSTQHLIESHIRNMDLAINGSENQLQNEDVVGDARDTDHCSTKEDSLRGEHEEDAWEGGMFPFCDEE